MEASTKKTNLDAKYLSYTISMMRRSGLWPHKPKEYLRGSVSVVSLVTCALMFIPCLDTANIDEFTFLLAAMVNTIIVCLKILFLKSHQFRGESMVRDMQNNCSRLADEFPEYKNLLEERENRMRKITKSLMTTMLVVFGSWLIIPILNAIGVITASGANLPVKLWYPMDLSQRLYFTLAVLHQMSFMVICALPYIMVNMIYITFISLTCGQLKIVSLGLMSLDKNNVHRRLPFCVETHSSILAFGKELELLMSPYLLMIFVAYVAMICQSLIQLSSGPIGSEQSLKFLLYLCLLLVEVWLYCYFGNQLIDYSLQVQNAAYSCCWYEMENNDKRNLVLIILRSQRPLRLTIGKMYLVSLETFTEVMKLCYSAFTLLREVNS